MVINKLTIGAKRDNPAKRQMININQVAQSETLSSSEINAIVSTTNELVEHVNNFNAIDAFNFKGNVTTYANLPTTGLTKDDAYGVLTDGLIYIYNGTSWPTEGNGLDLKLRPTGTVAEGVQEAVSGGEIYNKLNPLDLKSNEYSENFKALYNLLTEEKNTTTIPIGTFQDSATPQIFGLSNIGTIRNTSVIPIGNYTFYVKYKVNVKGNATKMAFFAGTQVSMEKDIVEGITEEVILQRNITTPLALNDIFFQIRSRYASSDIEKNLNITIEKAFIFVGNVSIEQVNNYINPDKYKVEKSRIADRALVADIATTIDKLPDSVVDKVVILGNKIGLNYPNTNVVNYDSTYGLQPTEYSINRVDGKLKITANVSNFLGNMSNQRVWFGIDFTPNYYATSSKNVFVVLQGRLKSTNVRNFKYEQSGGQSNIILQDLNDDVWTDFKAVVEFSYDIGTSTNKRYTYTNFDIRNGATSFNVEMEFDCFGVLEKNAQTENLSVDELIEAINVGFYTIKDKFLPKNLVNKGALNDKIDSLNLSKYSPNDYSANGVEMLIGYGQSLAVGGGASNSSTDFKNSVAFNGGVDISSYTSSVIPDSVISSFVPIANQTSYTPITASLVAMLELLQNENKVDVSKFGNKYLCVTGGVSGASITSMNKGTIPYSNLIKAITKAKQLANADGLPFKVSCLNWVQGEADRYITQSQYYVLLKQLFIDLNTDIKAITGQTDDVKFITYQTASWLNLWYPSGATTQQPGDASNSQLTITGVQKAQLQVVNELPNVYMCGAMYQFAYSDFFHPVDRAVVGLQQGVAMKRILVDGIDFPAFQLKSHQVIGNYINIKFDVPIKPMRFDLATDIWHNSTNGVRPYFGFQVLKSGVNIIAENPFIINGDTVVIKCSENPTGAELRYASDGHYGGGNLCDSQGIIINNKNINYKVDNFALSFDGYII